MAAKTFLFLRAIHVRRLHRKIISPTTTAPIQLGMLESAMSSPMNMKHYANEQDVFQLAANLAEKIAKDHAFHDGNKRTALLAADMFLKMNGHSLQKAPLTEDTHNGLTNAQVAIVTNQWTGKQLGDYYKSVSKPVTPETLEYKSLAIEY